MSVNISPQECESIAAICEARGNSHQARLIRALSDALYKNRPHWRHYARGSTYTEIGRGTLQASKRPAIEGDSLVAYRDRYGAIYFREQSEFEDGRFEKISNGSPT